MAWPEVPNTSDRTLPILTLASSNTFWTRFRSAAPSPTNVRRRRVKSRSSRISRGGMKLPCTNPCRSKLASHRLSFGSVFLPRSAFTCSGLAKMILRLPSKMLNTGFQYEPVLSITASVHPFSSSHVRNRSQFLDACAESPNLPDRLAVRQSNQNANGQNSLSHIDSRTLLDFHVQPGSSLSKRDRRLCFHFVSRAGKHQSEVRST